MIDHIFIYPPSLSFEYVTDLEMIQDNPSDHYGLIVTFSPNSSNMEGIPKLRVCMCACVYVKKKGRVKVE